MLHPFDQRATTQVSAYSVLRESSNKNMEIKRSEIPEKNANLLTHDLRNQINI